MTHRTYRFAALAFALRTILPLVGCDAEEPALDGRDEPFAGAGKGDTGGIAEGTAEAAAILQLASRATLDELTDEVGLHPQAAQAILDARAASGQPFASLAELDAVPYVGPVAFYKLLKHVVALGLPGGNTTKIYGPGEPLQLGGREYLLVDELLLAQRTVPVIGGMATTVDWQLHVKAEYLAYDARRDRLIAFGQHQLYVISRSGVIVAVYDEGYADIPNLRVDLLAGAGVCVVYQNLASYYQGRALASYMVGNAWAGSIYKWWQGYFQLLHDALC